MHSTPSGRRPGATSTPTSELAPQPYDFVRVHSDYCSFCVHHWVARPLENLLALAIPDKPDKVGFDVEHLRFVRSGGRLTPSDEAYMYLCRLCSIDSECLIVLRDPSITRLQPLAFAFSRYRKLLNLVDSLPESVRHADRAPPAVLFFQYIHTIPLTLRWYVNTLDLACTFTAASWISSDPTSCGAKASNSPSATPNSRPQKPSSKLPHSVSPHNYLHTTLAQQRRTQRLARRIHCFPQLRLRSDVAPHPALHRQWRPRSPVQPVLALLLPPVHSLLLRNVRLVHFRRHGDPVPPRPSHRLQVDNRSRGGEHPERYIAQKEEVSAAAQDQGAEWSGTGKSVEKQGEYFRRGLQRHGRRDFGSFRRSTCLLKMCCVGTRRGGGE